MKKFFRLTWADVSRHRPVLYGFAALWIAFLHMEYTVPYSGGLRYLRLFQRFGACGVEMFVLLTGAGLYRSMERDPDILHFYKKRFTRVFLPAVVVGLPFFYRSSDSVLEWIANTLYFPYWLGVNTSWFVAFILTMYLLYPFIYRIQKKQPWLLWAAMLLSLGALYIVSTMRGEWFSICTRGVARIPVFFFSCILAPRLERGFKFPFWLAPLSLASFGVFYRLSSVYRKAAYFWRTLSYVGLAIFLILLIAWLCEHVRLGLPGRFVYRCFAFCGSISLEIYLLFTRACRMVRKLPVYTSGNLSLLHSELLGLLLTILLSWLISLGCSLAVRCLSQLKSHIH